MSCSPGIVMDLKRNSVWILPLLLILTGPLWWAKAGDLLKPRGGVVVVNRDSLDPQTHTFVMGQAVFTSYINDREEFVLKAAHVRSGMHEEQLELEDVKAEFAGKDGRSTVMTGGEAYYDKDRQVITVIDNVRIQTPDGQLVKTEALRYLVRYRKVKTAEDVWLGDKSFQVRGGNLFYDLVDGNFRVGGRVSVDFL